MRITEEQEKILSRYKCERLTSDPMNKQLIKDFKSKKGELLVNYLQKVGWEEDLNGNTTFYLIKNPDGVPCVFFALKCGALFEPFDADAIQTQYKKAKHILSLLQNSAEANTEEDAKERASVLAALEKARVERNLPIEQVVQEVLQSFQQRKSSTNKVLSMYRKEMKSEVGRPILRVGKTYAGVEITHFCVNDVVKDEWKKYNFRFPMGEVLFWKYIAQIVIDIQKTVGCQYAFLFAADSSPDGDLVNYYHVALKFDKPTNMGTSKPYYDFCCEFMSQEIVNLKKNREAFFNDFNVDIDDVIA